MKTEQSIRIDRPNHVVFAWLSRVHEHPLPSDSRIMYVEKMTPGPPHPGTVYRERLRILPWFIGDLTWEIVALEAPRLFSSRFGGPGISGAVDYTLEPCNGSTLLHQGYQVRFFGPLALVAPWLCRSQCRRMRRRLTDIKAEVESWELYHPSEQRR